MESVEARAKRVIRKGRIQDSIIAALYLTAVVSLTVAAPNTLSLLKYLNPYIAKRNVSKRMSQAVGRLIARGHVERRGRGMNAKLHLTAKGRQHAERLVNDFSIALVRPKRWDGRWRIVMFDIWERRRDVRDQLRALLIRIGFVRIQNSVWAYPYDCEEVIALVRIELKAGKGISYLVADAIEGDRELRKRFGLSR